MENGDENRIEKRGDGNVLCGGDGRAMYEDRMGMLLISTFMSLFYLSNLVRLIGTAFQSNMLLKIK